MASLAPTRYDDRREALTTYFDRTAAKAWEALTSDAPVSRIRATVRAGRDAMRATLLDWLPSDMTGCTLLDAGCGTGALAVAAAERGARVTAIDVAGSLVEIARERAPAGLAIEWRTGDFLDSALGTFDHVVAMDSLIHYEASDIAAAVAALGRRTRRSLLITFAPKTPALTAMHTVGKLFPRGDRSPAIVPVGAAKLGGLIERQLSTARIGRTQRIASGFYQSQALEVLPR